MHEITIQNLFDGRDKVSYWLLSEKALELGLSHMEFLHLIAAAKAQGKIVEDARQAAYTYELIAKEVDNGL